MAYLHCHNKECGWSQDDFWSLDGYNPLREDIVNHLRESLFKDRVYIDKYAIDDLGIKTNFGYDPDCKRNWVNGKEYVMAILRQKVKQIGNMAVDTSDKWKEVKDTFVCPKCGGRNWDID